MVQSMGSGALVENYPIPLATHVGKSLDLGEFEESQDGRSIGMHDVSKGK